MAAAQKIKRTVYVGPFVHSQSLQKLDICPTGAIGVDENGKIAFVERDVKDVGDVIPVTQKYGWQNSQIVRIKDNGFLFPGFIDTHIHASQYPNTGIFGKSTLLDWLNDYTFPLESSLSDLSKARRVYNRVVARTLSHGTTTAAYYATIHVPATNLLADICLARGQRAFVGRVCMNAMSPEYYRDESVEAAMRSTRECIEHVRGIDPGFEIVSPIITPRFAPSCTTECLREQGKLHRETGIPCQTHISENKKEIELVKELFPESKSYADVYDSAGLLTEKTILAHAVHLTEEEKALVKEREAKISHCPASNTALTSGCARVRQLIDQGITVGLGTDVSGGFSPSMLEMVRQAVWVSRHVAMTDGDQAKLSMEEALYLATRGGAKVVGLHQKVGGFDVGTDWDAQMISLGSVAEDGSASDEIHGDPVDVWGWEEWEDRVAKWVYNGDDRNTAAVWVKGRLVHQRPGFQP
ncbi:guanine deaminase [Coniosporium apollinis CBS 100218]|uniref:Guanine deaminase n=1 Tax=Coniosporium apollinis (strain CBS 100218) TaxID=1168221 RepID=R7Z120_CONA1|nr:guanine deaminase [Coniosporium apollinis CBS 100218]EON67788.1 guanine deaminase [Coniosporium apollinis CBS 100218]